MVATTVRGSQKLLAVTLTAAIVLGILVINPAPASAANPLPAMGVQFHATWSDYTDAERLTVLDKMAAAGVKWVRVDVGWPSIEPNAKGTYAQWYVDRVNWTADAAAARGMQVLGTLWGTPNWANGGAGRATPPTNVQDFADAAGYIATQTRGKVAAWEVWNEPNHTSYWTGTPEKYAALIKAAYPAFKAGDPNAKVVFGGPAYNDDTFIGKVYAAGAAGSFDVMATHPYMGVADKAPETPDDGTKWTMTHVAAVKKLMESYGDVNKPIWFTEFGWSSHANTGTEGNWERGVSEQQQGDYLVRTLKLMQSSYPYVTNVFWYNERNRNSGKVHLDNYGLLNRDLTAKPAYAIMKDFLTAPAPEPTPDPIGDVLDLVTNGTFETGLTGWTATNGGLSRVTTAHTGLYGAKVTRKADAYGLNFAPASVSGAHVISGTGWVRSKRIGQTIKLIVTERVNGALVDREVVRTTTSTGWEQLPVLTYSTSGATDSEVTFKLRSSGTKGDYFFADDLSLISE